MTGTAAGALSEYLEKVSLYLERTLGETTFYAKSDTDLIRCSIILLLQQFPTFAVRILHDEPSDDGAENPVLIHSVSGQVALKGTVPITYRARAYDIPLSIRLPHEFPAVPPLSAVITEGGLRLKPQHPVVDRWGRCHLPLVRIGEWRKFHVDGLRRIVEELQAAFSLNPPLFRQSRDAMALKSSSVPNSSEPNSILSHSSEANRSALQKLASRFSSDDEEKEEHLTQVTEQLAMGQISVDTFLRRVRQKSWEQFMVRAMHMQVHSLMQGQPEKKLQMETEANQQQQLESPSQSSPRFGGKVAAKDATKTELPGPNVDKKLSPLDEEILKDAKRLVAQSRKLEEDWERWQQKQRQLQEEREREAARQREKEWLERAEKQKQDERQLWEEARLVLAMRNPPSTCQPEHQY
eukprot:TRINITY_DN16330_c0_g1_i1.p1 TRINITY_DN16330_c0_g1~~TRINITY_DN16330_c0_g1_i1.p1  ORF type:complete len:438 (+),score=135.32 TRINITY_DN16330_c0_g1_i1:90-1316(+)